MTHSPQVLEVLDGLVLPPVVGEAAVVGQEEDVRELLAHLRGGRVHRGHHDAALVGEVLHRGEDGLGHDAVQACHAGWWRGWVVRRWVGWNRGIHARTRRAGSQSSRPHRQRAGNEWTPFQTHKNTPHPRPHHTMNKTTHAPLLAPHHEQDNARTGAGLVEEDELRRQEQLRRNGEALALAAGDALLHVDGVRAPDDGVGALLEFDLAENLFFSGWWVAWGWSGWTDDVGG